MFYNLVKALCIQHNTNITRLAKELGISSSVPTAWKNGAQPRIDTVKKIADYFGVTAEYLLSSEGATTNIRAEDSVVVNANSGNVAINSNQLSEMEQEVLRIFRTLDMRDKNRVMSYLYNIEDELKK
jgi:transcriptional regulator with XRE-family HTH domain